jgi:hypothetical protein
MSGWCAEDTKEPRNAVPTPIPAIAMPARKTPADVSVTAANVTAAPAIKAIQPIIIVACADHARPTTVAVPARAVSRKMTRPQSRFRERNTSPAREGPSER